jgi:hypothetical protein
MAFANAYDIAQPSAPASSYFDVYGAAAGQPSTSGDREDAAILYAQHARELELFHLQQQIQERQVIENEARTRLLDYAARNQIQEYERARIEMALLAEIHQRDREARMLSQHEIDAAAAQNLQDQHFTEYMAQQKDQAMGYDSTPPHRWLPADLNETSALTEMKTDSTTLKKSPSSFKDDAAESVQKKEPASKKQSSPIKAHPPKKDPPPKKVPSPEKGPPPRKESTKKKRAPQKEEGDSKAPQMREGENRASQKDERENTAPQKEEGEKMAQKKEEVQLPLGTPSPSLQLALSTLDKKIASAERSSTASKKRKTPSKSSGAAVINGIQSKKARKSPSGSAGGKTSTSPSNMLPVKQKTGVPSMDDIVPDITDVQYENAKALMTVFCKVPFLAEFSRPVSLLHPEVCKIYLYSVSLLRKK